MGERAQAVSFPQEKGWANWGVQADLRVKDTTATAAFYETSRAVAAQTEGTERGQCHPKHLFATHPRGQNHSGFLLRRPCDWMRKDLRETRGEHRRLQALGSAVHVRRRAPASTRPASLSAEVMKQDKFCGLVLVLPLSSCKTASKLLNIYEPQFPRKQKAREGRAS